MPKAEKLGAYIMNLDLLRSSLCFTFKFGLAKIPKDHRVRLFLKYQFIVTI